jgi:hypothetical protein
MGIMAERLAWILEHRNHEGDDCLFYPFSADTSRQEWIEYGGRTAWSPARLMCTLAHGDPPPGKRFAVACCVNKNEGCISPKHLEWLDGKQRHNINRTILD